MGPSGTVLRADLFKKKTLRGYGCTPSGRCHGDHPPHAGRHSTRDDLRTRPRSARRGRLTGVAGIHRLQKRTATACAATGSAANGGGDHVAGQVCKRPGITQTAEGRQRAIAARNPAHATAYNDEMYMAAATASAASGGAATGGGDHTAEQVQKRPGIAQTAKDAQRAAAAQNSAHAAAEIDESDNAAATASAASGGAATGGGVTKGAAHEGAAHEPTTTKAPPPPPVVQRVTKWRRKGDAAVRPRGRAA